MLQNILTIITRHHSPSIGSSLDAGNATHRKPGSDPWMKDSCKELISICITLQKGATCVLHMTLNSVYGPIFYFITQLI